MKMKNSILCVSALTVLLAGASSVRAADVYWDGGGADDLWDTPANWVGDVLPGAGDFGMIDDFLTALVDGSVTASAKRVVVGMYDEATMDVTGGSITSGSGNGAFTVGRRGPGTDGPGTNLGGPGVLNVSGGTIYATQDFIIANASGSSGIMHMTGGTVEVTGKMEIGDQGVATLNMGAGLLSVSGTLTLADQGSSSSGIVNMTDGTINVTGDLILPLNDNGIAEFHLDGGLVTADDLTMRPTGNGSLDITAGVLELVDDDTSVIDGYINAGWLTGYGDSANVRRAFANGITTVTAVPEPSTMLLLTLGGLAALIRRKR